MFQGSHTYVATHTHNQLRETYIHRHVGVLTQADCSRLVGDAVPVVPRPHPG